MCPAPGAYIGPQLYFFWTDDAHPNLPLVFSSRWLNRPVKDVAEFDGPVVARAE